MAESALNDTYTFTYTTAPIPYNVHMDNFFAVLCLLSFTFGTVGNVLALLYFIRKKRDVSTIIYINVALVDLIIVILTLPVGISIFDERRVSVFFKHKIFCDAWGFIWTALARMSVFLAGLLSVYRAYFLTFPFRNIKKTVIIGIILAAFAIHILGASIPLWWDDDHMYHPAMASCISFGGETMPAQAILATKVFDYLGMLIPVPVIIGSFVVTVLQLAKKTTARGGRGDDCEQNITVSVTITIFTGTYLFFNVPAVVVMLLYNFFDHNLWPKFVYLIAYVYVMVVPLNAACNPVIYLCRMKQMREQSLRVFRCTLSRRRSLSGPGQDPVTAQSNVAGYTKLSNEGLCNTAL